MPACGDNILLFASFSSSSITKRVAASLGVSRPSAELFSTKDKRIKDEQQIFPEALQQGLRSASPPSPSSPAYLHHLGRKHPASSLFFSAAKTTASSGSVFFFKPVLLLVGPSRSPLSSRCKEQRLGIDASSHSHDQRELLIHSQVERPSVFPTSSSNHTPAVKGLDAL